MPFHDYSTAIPRPTFFCDFFNHPNSFVGFHHDGFTGHMFPNLGPPQKQLIMPGGGPVVKPHFGPLLLCLSSSALQSRRPFFFGQGSFFIFFPSRSRGIHGYPHSYGTHITSSPRWSQVGSWRKRIGRALRWADSVDMTNNSDDATKVWENVRRQTVEWIFSSIPIGSMYSIYGNIYHQYTPNVSIYTIYMDPMGFIIHLYIGVSQWRHIGFVDDVRASHMRSMYEILYINIYPLVI